MPIYWEQSACGVWVENFDMKEDYEIQKPHMKNVEDEEQSKDPTVNIMLIFNMQMNNKSVSNNYRSERFGIQRFEEDMSEVSVESTIIFTQSSDVFKQSSNLLPQSVEKSVQSTNVFSQLINGFIVSR